MRSIQACVLLLSRTATENSPVRPILAALSLLAGMREDKFARTSYLEGILGYSPGALIHDPEALKDAQLALLDNQEGNKIVDALRHQRGMSDRDISLMLGQRDTGLFASLMNGILGVMPTAVRGLEPEDIAMALSAGISPITGGPLKYGHGKGVFYHLGEYAPGKVSLMGIKRITAMEARNRALDVVRNKSKEQSTVSIDAPIGTGEDVYTLADIIQGDTQVSRADYIDLAAAIYHDPWIMNILDEAVRESLKTPAQLAIWNIIKANPEHIKVTADNIGLASQAGLAQEVSKALGTPYEGKTTDINVGSTFRNKVWPAMKDALSDDVVAQRLLKNHHILDIIQEATKKVPKTREHIPAPAVEPKPISGPARVLSPEETAVPEHHMFVPKNTPAWLQRLRHNPDLRALRQMNLRMAFGSLSAPTGYHHLLDIKDAEVDHVESFAGSLGNTYYGVKGSYGIFPLTKMPHKFEAILYEGSGRMYLDEVDFPGASRDEALLFEQGFDNALEALGQKVVVTIKGLLR